MKEVTTYTRSGKVPHDDAPDSLSLLENEIRMLSGVRWRSSSVPTERLVLTNVVANGMMKG